MAVVTLSSWDDGVVVNHAHDKEIQQIPGFYEMVYYQADDKLLGKTDDLLTHLGHVELIFSKAMVDANPGIIQSSVEQVRTMDRAKHFTRRPRLYR